MPIFRSEITKEILIGKKIYVLKNLSWIKNKFTLMSTGQKFRITEVAPYYSKKINKLRAQESSLNMEAAVLVIKSKSAPPSLR